MNLIVCQKTVQEIISNYPTKNWFLSLINDTQVDFFPKDLIQTLECIITKCFDNNDLNVLNYELEVVYQLTWERINFGMFEDVPLIWRKLFAISCLLIIFINLKSCLYYTDLELLKRCLYLCDMSLMMGGELSENYNLGASVARDIHGLIAKEEKIITESEHYLTYSDFNPLQNIPNQIKNNLYPLERIDAPSISEFLNILHKSTPVILTNVISNWPALSTNRWSVEYIKKICGYRTVPIEIGSSYAESNWTQQLMTINEFIEKYFYQSTEASDSKAYLAQHYLFSQISELNDDIEIPDYCFMNSKNQKTEIDINGWFGPAGTVSPLHQDPKHNFLCQIFGEKYIKLYLPDQTDFLYPNSTTMLKNTSRIDVLSPDLEVYPLFSNARGFDCFLKPGEILFIPPKCWHYVTSLSPSFSVNFWWNYE